MEYFSKPKTQRDEVTLGMNYSGYQAQPHHNRPQLIVKWYVNQYNQRHLSQV